MGTTEMKICDHREPSSPEFPGATQIAAGILVQNKTDNHEITELMNVRDLKLLHIPIEES